MSAEVTAQAPPAPPRRGSSRGTLIGALVALVSFLLLISLIVVMARQPAGPATSGGGARVSVLVASRNLNARQLIGAGDLAVKQMYEADVPTGARGADGLHHRRSPL